MYSLLIRLIVLAALMDLGLTIGRDGRCETRLCFDKVERASRKVLKIEWKPIKIFPYILR